MALPDSVTLFAPPRLSTLPALTSAAAPDASVRELPPYRLDTPDDEAAVNTFDDIKKELPPYKLATSIADDTSLFEVARRLLAPYSDRTEPDDALSAFAVLAEAESLEGVGLQG